MPARRRLMAALAALAALGACAGAGSQGTGADAAREAASATRPPLQDVGLDVSAPTMVHPGAGLFPTTAVDPRSGAVYASWAREVPGPASRDEDPLLEAVVARSDDNGATFGEPVVVSPPGMPVHTRSVSPTQVEVGPGGEVFVLFKHVEDLPGYDSPRRLIHLVRSDDGGRTFSEPVDVASEAVEGVVSSTDMLDLFVAPDGDVFVAFLDSREKIAAALAKEAAGAPVSGHRGGHRDEETPEVNTMRLARSTDGGRTFAPSVLVAKPVCVCCATQVAQGQDTPLFATTRSEWMELKGSTDAVRDPFLSISRDEGRTWSEAVKIHDDRFKVSGCPDVNAGLAVDSKGRLHAAWYTGTDRGPGVYYAVSDDDGETFSEPMALLADEWVPYADVVMAVDDDAAWIAYEDRRSDDDQIQVARVDAEGRVTYSEAWPGNTPELAARDDEALVVWSESAGEDSEDGGLGPVKFARVTAR